MTAPTADEIQNYLASEERRKNLQRQAEAEERAAAPLKKRIREFVEAKGGRDRTTTHAGYVLALSPWRQANVPWKDEFTKLAGPERVVELQNEQPMLYMLKVEPEAKAGQ